MNWPCSFLAVLVQVFLGKGLERSVSTLAPPHASDSFKTDSAPFLPHSYFFCWSDLFMWMLW